MRDSDFRVINKFKVRKNVWSGWTLVAKHVFNKTYESMTKDPELFLHPNLVSQPRTPKEWETTAWNAAWIAASVCSRGERHLLKDLTEKVKS